MMDQLAHHVRRIPASSKRRAVSLMERAPQFVIYALHGPYAFYLTLRYGGLTLPTIANPGLDGSGLTGESKTEMLNLLGPLGRAHLPPFVTISTGPKMLEEAAHAMEVAGLSFPVVVKPDVGRRGFGVRAVHNSPELAAHLRKFP